MKYGQRKQKPFSKSLKVDQGGTKDGGKIGLKEPMAVKREETFDLDVQ